MNATTELHTLGQSLWLDNITRDLLNSGTLHRYISDYAVTGLTSNPTIFDQAISDTKDYDEAIEKKVKDGKSGESLFFELAIEDLKRAAALLLPAHAATGGMDGWVSLEVSPLLADDAQATIEAAKRLHASAACANALSSPASESRMAATLPAPKWRSVARMISGRSAPRKIVDISSTRAS